MHHWNNKVDSFCEGGRAILFVAILIETMEDDLG